MGLIQNRGILSIMLVSHVMVDGYEDNYTNGRRRGIHGRFLICYINCTLVDGENVQKYLQRLWR